MDDTRGLLILRDVRVSDSGVYVCQITDGVSRVFDKVTLTVGGMKINNTEHLLSIIVCL